MSVEGLEIQENENEFVEMSQEDVAKELSGEGTGGANEENSNHEQEFQMPISKEELEVYTEFVGEDIPKELFLDDEGKSLSKVESLRKLNSLVSLSTESKLLNDDPFIKSYIDAKQKEGFNRDDYMKSMVESVKLQDMDSNKFLKEYYKDKYSEEDIEKFINGKTKIELDELAAKGKHEIEQRQSDMLEQTFEKSYNSKMQDVKTQNESTYNALEDNLDNVLLSGKHPLKFTESNVKDVFRTMKDLTTRVLVKDGNRVIETSKLNAFMSDDSKLLKILPYIALEELGQLDDFSRRSINDIKDAEFEKIESANSFGTGGNSSGGKNWGKFFG